MRTVVIGGSGHIGTYLVPRLVELGHDVILMSRQQSRPYVADARWRAVRQVALDRTAQEAQGRFGQSIAELQPDVVVDLICFTLPSCRQLVEALRGKVQQFVHCGTIWVHGPSAVVPTTEDAPRRPFGEYGVNKAQIEAFLLEEARRGDFPATVLHPGHLVGPGWEPINPAGHRGLEMLADLANGREVRLPNLGMEMLHHVHADDVAQAFEKAMTNWGSACGENFHVVSTGAVTLRGYADAVAGWFGREPRLQFVPWQQWRTTVSMEEAQLAEDHMLHSPNCSIAKAQRLLGYAPRYTSLQAIKESVDWLVAHGRLAVEGQRTGG